MLIKATDDKTKDIDALKLLSARPDASADTRKKVEQEIRNIQSGIKGEAEAAYEIEFHYGASKNWMALHDLRLECEGRVAQIDHLLINRFLEIYVCESKRFAEGIAVNEQGEFAAFHGGKAYGIPSPVEQNQRHMVVLESVFKCGQVAPPKRFGITLSPTLNGLVLVSKNARIGRPKTKIEGIDSIIKNDQLKTRIDKEYDSNNNPLLAVRLIGQDTLEDFARRLAAAHKPVSFDWPARFGLSGTIVKTVKTPARTEPAPEQLLNQTNCGNATAPTDEVGGKKSKLACATCGTIVAYNIAKFCWFNKPRFAGNVYCMECQKAIPKPA
ncbi:MAG: nuclease-related domain-containing protein [Candidatus Accumulibacter necessarius]|jgi:hypothetical protein